MVNIGFSRTKNGVATVTRVRKKVFFVSISYGSGLFSVVMTPPLSRVILRTGHTYQKKQLVNVSLGSRDLDGIVSNGAEKSSERESIDQRAQC